MNSLEIFPEEVWTQIFSSLDRTDLLQASLVSKDCHRIIGRSTICMAKLWIEVRKNIEDIECILASSRLYQHFRCYLKNEKVTTAHLEVWSAIVDKFSKTLVSIRLSHYIETKSSFPNLKELTFSDYDCRHQKIKSLIIPNGLLTQTVDLMRLEVDFQWLDQISIKCLSSFFTENSTLKVLIMNDSRPMRLIEPTAMKMKLEKFYLYGRHWSGGHHRFQFINIYDFFMTQTSSLNTVQCTFSPEVMQFFISNFPNLHTLTVHLTIQDYNAFGSANPDYSINKSIKFLDLGIYSTNIVDLRAHVIAIITNLHNLETLKIFHFNKELLDDILRSRSLKTVEFDVLDSDVNII